MLRALVAALLIGLASASVASAVPQGDRVAGGASISRPGASTLLVPKATDKAIFNCNSFSIATNEPVREPARFLRPGEPIASRVGKQGRISAGGGERTHTAKAVSHVLIQVVNNRGIIRARRIVNHGGLVRLEGSSPIANTGEPGRQAIAAASVGLQVDAASPVVEVADAVASGVCEEHACSRDPACQGILIPRWRREALPNPVEGD